MGQISAFTMEYITIPDDDLNVYLRYANKFGFSCTFCISDSTEVKLMFVFQKFGTKFRCIHRDQIIRGGDDGITWYQFSGFRKRGVVYMCDFIRFTVPEIKNTLISNYPEVFNGYMEMMELNHDQLIDEIKVEYDLVTQYNVLRSLPECGAGDVENDRKSTNLIKERLTQELLADEYDDEIYDIGLLTTTYHCIQKDCDIDSEEYYDHKVNQWLNSL